MIRECFMHYCVSFSMKICIRNQFTEDVVRNEHNHAVGVTRLKRALKIALLIRLVVRESLLSEFG